MISSMKQKIIAYLVVSLIMGAFISLAQANPIRYHESVSPPRDAKPLNILVFSPLSNSLQKENTINITLNINNKDTSMISILDAYLEADWIENETSIYRQNRGAPEFPNSWNYSKVFSDIPDGEHKVTIYAEGNGFYLTNEKKGLTAHDYFMTTTTVLLFIMDSTSPQVLIDSPAVNVSYNQSSIPLNFTVNEDAVLVTYSLDGKENQTYSQNVTLSELSEGKHNLTVYALDEAGNIGSQMTYFSVEFPSLFPTAILLASFVATSVLVASLLVYFRYRRASKQAKFNLSRNLDKA